MVRAAGGVIWRRGHHGVEILLVHRPKYDDWSLPKGKSEPGETAEECARREVTEETGLECELGPEIAGNTYVDGKGRPKAVRYWSMTVPDAPPGTDPFAAFTPNDEVDEVRWLAVDRAEAELSYPRDAAVVHSLRVPPSEQRGASATP